MSLPTSEQPAPVFGPPLPAVLPVGCSTPLRGAASSLAGWPARSNPLAVPVSSVVPLEGCATPLSSAVSTQVLQPVCSGPVLEVLPDSPVVGDDVGARGSARNFPVPLFTRPGRQYSRTVDTP
jgi:hypothetical protein